MSSFLTCLGVLMTTFTELGALLVGWTERQSWANSASEMRLFLLSILLTLKLSANQLRLGYLIGSCTFQMVRSSFVHRHGCLWIQQRRSCVISSGIWHRPSCQIRHWVQGQAICFFEYADCLPNLAKARNTSCGMGWWSSFTSRSGLLLDMTGQKIDVSQNLVVISNLYKWKRTILVQPAWNLLYI